MSFDLVGLPPLSRFTIDRCEPLRGDEEKITALWHKARMIVVDSRGRPAVEYGDQPLPNAVLLGEQDGVVYFAVPVPVEGDEVPAARAWSVPELTDEPQWLDLR